MSQGLVNKSIGDGEHEPKAAAHLSQPEADPAAYVDALALEARRHRALCHPYLKALALGSLPDPGLALKQFARHYHGYSVHFPRYLTAVISQLERPEHRSALMENLTEESGSYDEQDLVRLEERGILREWIVEVPHPELFARFRRVLGLSDDDHGGLEVASWRDMFHTVLAHGTAAEAIGALGLGTENVVADVYAYVVQAIEREDLAPRDVVFFPLHCDVDHHHQEVLRAIAIDMAQSPEGRDRLRRGMRRALYLRAGFWDFLHQLALGNVQAADV